MTIELQLLGIAIIIGLVQIMLQASTMTSAKGTAWNVGPRDEPGAEMTPLAGRLNRALTNYFETFPLFAAAMLAVLLAGKMGDLTYWGGMAYVVGRALYVPLYAFGVSYARSLAWVVATGGIVAIVVALFQ